MTITSLISSTHPDTPRRAQLIVDGDRHWAICRTGDNAYAVTSGRALSGREMDRLVAAWLAETVVLPYHAARSEDEHDMEVAA